MSASDALLSVRRGSSKTLPTEKTDGQILFTTDTEKLLLDFVKDGILHRSTVNPNPDWNATSGNAVILNKPTIPTAVSDLSGADSLVSTTDSRLSDTRTPKSHAHGNISNAGAITSDTAVANGDKLVVTDSSGSDKLIRTAIAFDGTTATQALTPKGTWETFVTPSDSRLSDARTPVSHAHGNVSNTGAITSDTAVADGDKLVVTDSSASSKLIRTGISFDGSTTTKALTPKGTWEEFIQAGDSRFVASDDSRLTNARTPTSHAHGNITNAGAITSDTAVANGDKIVVTDSSASSKLIRTAISFDGSTTNKALTPKGTWVEFQAPVSMSVTNGVLTFTF